MRKAKKVIALLLTVMLCVTGIESWTMKSYASEDYRTWAQGDSRWGSIRLGSSSDTMAQSGCLVTAVTKLIVQSGLKDADTFNPGTMVNWLNNNSGFTASGGLYYAKPAECVSGFSYYGPLLSQGTYSSSNYNSNIISWINAGYHMVLNVNGGGHWIAVDEAKTLATGQVYIMDSLSGRGNADVTLTSRYSTFTQVFAYKGGKTGSSFAKPTISEYNVPNSMNVGTEFDIAGWINASTNLINVTVGCYDEAGNMKTGCSTNPKWVTFNLDNLNGGINFNVLSPGKYKYKVIASTETCTVTLVEKTFCIVDELPIVSEYNTPNSMSVGTEFEIRGWVDASITLTDVTVGCYDEKGNMKIGSSINPHWVTYNLSNFNSEIDFSSLVPGKYKYKVIASTEAGTVTLVEKTFCIVDELPIVSEYNTPSNMSVGTEFEIRGWVDASITLTDVTVGCYDEKGNMKIGSSINPHWVTYNLSNFNSEIDFSSLVPGKYKYKVIATTAVGSVILIDKDFVVLGDTNPFTDVNTTDYYYTPVLWAVEKGITDGWTPTQFAPNMACTRGQVVTFLWRAAGQPKVAIANPFTDVAENAYYYDAVLWAVENGITDGWTQTQFAPDMECTRGQIVTFLWRAAGHPDVATGTNPFADVAANAYYYEPILWAVKEGITDGWTQTQFAPEMNCTRGQIVTFLYRYHN